MTAPSDYFAAMNGTASNQRWFACLIKRESRFIPVATKTFMI
jgi:hypothetical protein